MDHMDWFMAFLYIWGIVGFLRNRTRYGKTSPGKTRVNLKTSREAHSLGDSMERIGIEPISNGYIVYGVEEKTYRENLVDAGKELELERKKLVKNIEQSEKESK